MTRETVGKISRDLSMKETESRDPIEIQRATEKAYLDELIDCVKNNKNNYHGDFYIIAILKNEKLMPNVFRNYFVPRTSCPTPEYDQTVYKYNSVKEEIEYLWTIPCKSTVQLFRQNALHIVTQEQQLLKFVLDFCDGTLDKLARKLNKETKESPIIMLS